MRTILLWTLACATILADDSGKPSYASNGEMQIPVNYRQWQFVGSNLGIGYSDPSADSKPGSFKNIYIRPDAYKAFKETGKFPDKTVLVMEVFTAGEKASPAKTGHFEEKLLGIEAAVKDEAKFPEEKWAYYNFIGKEKALPTAKAFPKNSCWSCHKEHASVDNVFVQFYPVLRDK